MSEYILSCCSTVDLSKEHLESRNLQYICFHYELGGKEYLDDLGETVSFADFYQAMQDGADTKTSQINAAEYEEYFEKFSEILKKVYYYGIFQRQPSNCRKGGHLDAYSLYRTP